MSMGKDELELQKHLEAIKKAYLLNDEDDGLMSASEAIRNDVEAIKKIYSRVKNFIKERYERYKKI